MEAVESCTILDGQNHHSTINCYICFICCYRCYLLDNAYFTYVKNIVVCVFICLFQQLATDTMINNGR